MYLLSVIETGTKTQWDIPKQTLSILKCFSSLKQIDFFLLYHLPIFKAGKGQHIGSCYLPMFVADSPLKLVRAAADARFWVQCLHSAWSWEREPSPPVKAFTEFSLNSVSSGILPWDMLSKTTSWEFSLQLTQCLQGGAAFLGPYRAHPPCHRRIFRVKTFQLWSQNTKNYFKFALRKSKNRTLGVYTWNTLKQGTNKVLEKVMCLRWSHWTIHIPEFWGKQWAVQHIYMRSESQQHYLTGK